MLFTSLYVYICEGLLFLGFASGLWWFLGRYVTPLIKRLFPGINVDQRFLQRFAAWQIIFVAAWSVLFKIALPIRFHSATGPLFKGPSQWFAGAAEWVGAIFFLIAIVRGLLFVNSYFRTLLNREEDKHAKEGA